MPPAVGAKSVAHGGDPVPMTNDEFQEFTGMVRSLTGIVIQEHKRQMIVSRLTRRLRALKMNSFGSYLDHVKSPKGAGEHEAFVNAVTTNLTSFYREDHHFEHFAEQVVKPYATAGGGRFRVWSSACSSGEEPYSIMISAAIAAGGRLPTDFKLLATDLDTNMLDRSRRGVYAADRIDGLPAAASAHYDKVGNEVRMKASLKSHMTFNQLNLLHEWPVKGPFDVIFCRNVLIYFDGPTKRQVVDRLTALVKPGGFLYLGHSESMLGENPALISHGRTIFEKAT